MKKTEVEHILSFLDLLEILVVPSCKISLHTSKENKEQLKQVQFDRWVQYYSKGLYIV